MENLFAIRYPVRTVYSCLYTFVFFVFLLSIIFTLCVGETDTVFSANLAHFMSIAVFFVTLNRFCEAAAMVNVSSGQQSLMKTFVKSCDCFHRIRNMRFMLLKELFPHTYILS